MAHVIKITHDDLQTALHFRTVGPFEMKLLEIAAQVKSAGNGQPLFVRIDFPEDGGAELRVRRGMLARFLWRLCRDVQVWKK